MAFTERQIEIIQSATRLIGERGIQNLTTKKLAADLGLSEPALYRHFRNKDELLSSLLSFYQSNLQGIFGEIIANPHSGMEKVADLIRKQFAHFNQNPAMVMVIMAESSFVNTEKLSDSVARLIGNKHRLMESLIVIGQKDGSIRKDIAAEQLAPLVLGSMRMTVLRWRLSQFQFDLREAGDQLTETLKKTLQS